MDKKLISLVVPVLNEEENLEPFYNEVCAVIDRLSDDYNFEFVFTDNHSEDNTFEELRKLHAKDPRVRVLRFSRNFGYQRSILTGYLNGRGDALIQLDCDLQDPPELIPDFLRAWEQGHFVVYGIRRTVQDSSVLKFARRVFYRMINYLSDDELPLDAGDFRLVDRSIVEVLRQIDDAQPYLRGTIASMGFPQQGIPYDRRQRERGHTKFKLKNLVMLAMDGILNHSIVPLRIASFFGIIISIFTLLAIAFYTIGKAFFALDWPAGFTTLAVLILGGISVNALFLGIIGEYLGRIYQQVKKRPLSIVQEELGTASRSAKS
ncbi:MAG: glycosyltransferase family 2 protein [Pseudomonadales bacterium]|nr:glycosyltransferase family 2 protein [Pseudomonadales bacterium]